MAGNFLAKWLGRNAAPGSELETTRADLQRLIAQQPDLSSPAQWLDAVLSDLLGPGRIPIKPLAIEIAQAKLQAGSPLLRGETLEIDQSALSRRWQHACDALVRFGDNGTDPNAVKTIRGAKIEYGELVAALVAGQSAIIDKQAADLAVGPDLMRTLIRCTIFPDFVALNDAWERDELLASWERGYCPTCGCSPLLGEFRGLEQIRYLRCGWCAASWKVPRLFCSHCGNRDHMQLGFFHREGDENHTRAATCQACGHYLKMVTTLRRLTPIQLWVADISTIYLDLAIAEKLFTR